MTNTFIPIRLHPGEDLKNSLTTLVRAHNLRAPYIASAVGSLKRLQIRLAHDLKRGQNDVLTRDNECFEITSLVGTLSPEGMHVHLCVSDKAGNMIGGHLMEGCVVFTTCEIVVGELNEWSFTRELDPATGCKELVILPREQVALEK
ncbi:hypothetical protein HK104_011423 [Borealophlyctis nickersoniae]|nr:hypothetical protein HK104_011423 [Borealophlyctis nickersoniae]